jgi:hypothetical protein
MPSLHDVQRVMRRSLLNGGAAEAADLIVGDGLLAARRLDVYRNTILQALAGALRVSFPVVHRLVGADFFEGSAQAFAAARPPRCADLNAYGADFPQFLQGFAPAATLAYLPDVARLEWAVNRALHAPDAEPLALAALTAVAPRDHARVRFIVHPSVSLIRSDYPIDAIWHAVLQQDDEAMGWIDLGSGPVHLIVQRLRDRVDVARIDALAWRLACVLFDGQPIGAALSSAPGADAPISLAGHLAAGRFVAFELAETATEPLPIGETP